MKILIAEDDSASRQVLEETLQRWGHDIVTVVDGEAAWDALSCDDAPGMAILDWMMPGIDGPEICRRLRTIVRSEPLYVILLTARDRTEDIVAGLDSGANDFVTKPFRRKELQARIRVGERMLLLQRDLAERIGQLRAALDDVKQLRGLLPICGYCKNVRDDKNYWHRVESYLAAHSDIQFSHGICPDCYRDIVKPELDAFGISEDES